MSSSSFHGLLVIDKPSGITSRAAVDRAKRWFPRGTRLGHTGTLDPLATGVLVLCVGQATRLSEYVQDMPKIYRAGLVLGARSDTDDADGTITPLAVDQLPDTAALLETLRGFIGEIDQAPPAFSAAKVAGQRAYYLARRGEEVSLLPRKVRIDAIDVLAYEYPHLELEVHCGKGTYIRALARDLGDRLGCGALVESLRRTRVGTFEADGALKLDADSATARAALLPLSAAVAALPPVTLDHDKSMRLRQGQAIPLASLSTEDSAVKNDEVAAYDLNGSLIGIIAVDWDKRLLLPRKVLRTDGKL